MQNIYTNQAINGQPKPSIRGMQLGMPVNTIYGPGRIVNIQRSTSSGNVNMVYASSLNPYLITVLITNTQKPITALVSAETFGSFNGALKIGGATLL